MELVRTQIERLGVHGFADVPRDVHFFPALAMLAEAVHLLDDGTRAEQLHALLAPHADRNVVASYWSPTFVGSVARYLGLLAATAGRADDAARHSRRQRANPHGPPGPARAHEGRPRACCSLATAGSEHALRLVAEARTTAEELGLARLRERITRLSPPPLPPAPEAASAEHATLRRDGALWTVGLGGQTIQLKDGPGLGYLAMLVREPGREFHVLDLAGPSEPDAPTRQAFTGDAGELLDAPARAAYRSRLVDLENELEEAERFNVPAASPGRGRKRNSSRPSWRGPWGWRLQPSCRGGERARPRQRHQGPRRRSTRSRRVIPPSASTSRRRPARPSLLLRPGSAPRPALEDDSPVPGGADEHCPGR